MNQLKREVFNFGNGDKERLDIVEFKFRVQRNSIQNFIELLPFKWNVKSIGDYVQDGEDACYFRSLRLSKWITVRIYAFQLFELAKKFGKNEWDYMKDYYVIQHSFLRHIPHRPKPNEYTVYNPVTHTIESKSNSPVKMEKQTQRLIDGNLWRRYGERFRFTLSSFNNI